MNRQVCAAAFALGLGVVAWVGHGYLGSSVLALTMTALIAAVYLAGAAELLQFQRATSGLRSALVGLPETPTSLGDWLARVPPSLQNVVRLRIEGERVGLPGPAMTPYLVGLLVLLGMLGTFLGMVVTLKGAVMALESTTDLATIRAALAAPVKGLGLAFGTSVAGVAASAMLGLVSALCRRDRLQAAQHLDARIATTLRVFSLAHQREEMLDTLQRQSRAMPELVDKVQALMVQMAQQAQDANESLLSSQDRFQRQAQTAYADLAASVDHSLKDSLAESARSAGTVIQPAVEATLQAVARETARFQAHLAGTVQTQLEGLSARFDETVTTVAGVWTGAHAATQTDLKATMSELARQTSALNDGLAQAVRAQLDGVSERFDATASRVSQTWGETLAQHRDTSESLAGELRASLASLVANFEQQSSALLATVDRAHAALHTDAAAQDRQRLAAWTQALQTMATSLESEWRQTGAQTLRQQEQVCRTMEQTARDIQARAEVHARDTLAETSRLIDAAAAAPRAAAEVVGQLREKLSDSMARDNALLEERSRVMGTLNSLLDAVNQAATQQRAAIDALVAQSAAMLQQAGTQFGQTVEAEAGKLAAVAAQVTGGAVEVASLGEAFGAGVQLFGQSSESLVDQLQRIEAALSKSTARSDEQLAYYVAQAREIIDLSLSSQKQIVEDLQRLAVRREPLVGEVA